MRPTSDRRPTDTRRAANDADDPLIELARMVAGKGTFDSPAPRNERPQPAPRAPVPSESDLARDLESELLNELQASFSMLREPFAPAPPPPAAASRIAAPQIAVAPPVAAAPPPPPPPPPVPVARPPVARLPERPERSSRADPYEPWPDQPERGERRERPQPPRQEARQERIVQPAPAADRVTPFRPPVQQGDRGNTQFRPSPAPQGRAAQEAPPARAAQPPARSEPSRWVPRTERRADVPAQRPAPLRNLAPPRQPAPEHRPVPFQDEPLDDALSLQDDGFFDDPADENFDLVPGYGDEDLLPPFPEEELAAMQPKRSGRSFMMIAGLFAVVVIGGAAAILLRSGAASSTPPQIIAADTSPTKVVPQTGQPATEEEGQAKLIYDRVNPGDEAASSQLAAQENDPISDVPAQSEESSNPISRVILPGGPGIDSPANATDPAATATATPTPAAEGETGKIQPIGPKKVRTVVVRPDGTIVSSEAAPADGSAPAADTSAPQQLQAGATEQPASDASAPTPPPADEPAATATATPPAAPATDTAELEAAAQNGGEIAGSGEAIPLTETDQPAGAAADSAQAATEQIADPKPPAKPVKKVTTKPVETASNDAPVDLAPAAPRQPAGAQQTASLGGAMLVQVSSQRSEETAQSTFRDLQKRFPTILGKYEPNIQRADLGGRGVYYRVRVGPFTGPDAQKVCEALKGAGGDCILAPR